MTQLSTIDSRITLDFLLNAPEDQYFERKWIDWEWLKCSKLANEIIWMLNADGWIVVVWVSDNKTLQDLAQLWEEKLNEYRKICFDFIAPPANVELEEIIVPSGELIFIYHIDQDYERVFTRKNTTYEEIYLRIGDSNKWPLTREESRKLEYDKSIRKFEDELRDDFDSADFRNSVLVFYRNKTNFTWTFEELLVKRNLAVLKNNQIFYKNSAILLFAEDPDKYIPSTWVRYVRYSWTEIQTGSSLNIIKDEEFRWCIPRVIELLKRFIYASLKDYYYLDISQWKFIKISEYPEEAWLEGIVNALCHRSYNIQWNPIYIKHFDDRIEISNSWPLPAQVTISNIRNERFSRNPRVTRVLADMWYVRELNEWVKRIYESMEKSMLLEPEYIDRNNIVTLILRNKISNHEKTVPDFIMQKVEKNWWRWNDTQRGIITFLFEHNESTLDDISKYINKHKDLVRKYLGQMVDDWVLIKDSIKLRDINALYKFNKNDK